MNESSASHTLTADELSALVAKLADPTHGCPILDLRTQAGAPPNDHLPGSAWLNPAAAPWPPWLMPARGDPLYVVGPEAEARAEELTARGWPSRGYEGPLSSRDLRPGSPRGALWNVDPLISRSLSWVGSIAADVPVLDLGSGSSREGVFFAQRGHAVTCVDRLPDALALAASRARHHGVSVNTIERKLVRVEDLPGGPFGIVLQFRFLRPALLLGLQDLVGDGGLLILRCYGRLEDSNVPEAATGGPKKRSERISPGELSAALGEGWEWLEGPRATIEDGALWTLVVARRRA